MNGLNSNSLLDPRTKKNAKTIMVTSTVPSEGKTTISVNLSLSLARHSYRTLLIDCDLRNPSVYKMLCQDGKTAENLSDYLRGNTELDNTIFHYNDNLDIIAENSFNSEASELVGSEKMIALIKEMKEVYDLVIVDTPPAGVVSESLSLANHVDGLVYVIRQDYVRTAKIIDEIDRYSDSGIKKLNVVLNMSQSSLLGESSLSGSNGRYGRYGNKYYYQKYNRYSKNKE